jgi:hypothetical protein
MIDSMHSSSLRIVQIVARGFWVIVLALNAVWLFNLAQIASMETKNQSGTDLIWMNTLLATGSVAILAGLIVSWKASARGRRGLALLALFLPALWPVLISVLAKLFYGAGFVIGITLGGI